MDSIMVWLYLIVAIVAEVIATSALKASQGFTVLVPSLIVIVGYAIAFYLLALTLDRMPIGIAYAVWSALGIVLVTLVGAFWYGQTLDAPAIIGMGLIVAGVMVIQLLSSSVTH